ncbi:hypothetical protein SH1V18_39100 [Vallitalea longa]|uniref:Uncharacterized protein n=1 Tax=Vallitalea longa TaxID=2936439 RepID=A0A9W5YF93_9FIRM|nr:hypothetical protein [Vallitalea longa]GKX31430.1 hypothetical protein SH1V18_39100 [Vallitalea longa]
MKKINTKVDESLNRIITKNALGNSFTIEATCFLPDSYLDSDNELKDKHQEESDIIKNDLNGRIP